MTSKQVCKERSNHPKASQTVLILADWTEQMPKGSKKNIVLPTNNSSRQNRTPTSDLQHIIYPPEAEPNPIMPLDIMQSTISSSKPFK